MTAAPLALAATAALPVGAVLAGVAGRAVRTLRGGRVALAVVLATAATALAAELLASPAPGAASHVGAWAGLAGLALTGAAVAGFHLPRALGRALPLLLLSALLDGAPAGWGLFAEAPPFGVEATARLLDASPRAMVMETAGVDWMRDPAIYGPAGADRLGPDVRAPYAVRVAGLRVLLLGCGALAARILFSMARRRPIDPWRLDAFTAPSPPR